jgi:hypothetical protein
VGSFSPQLSRIATELEEARRLAHRLAEPLDEDGWATRPGPDRWSVAECLIHLNATSRGFLPLLRRAIAEGRGPGPRQSGPYRLNLVGRFLLWSVEPPVRFRVKTTAPFVPPAVEPRAVVLAEFDRLQNDLLVSLHEADGLRLGKLKITSPFDPRFKYNLYAAFRILPAHQRRHLWQAERVVEELENLNLTREPGRR